MHQRRLYDYAPRTIETYLCCLRVYTTWISPTPPRGMGKDVPRSYLTHFIEAGASRSLIDQHVSALKFVYQLNSRGRELCLRRRRAGAS